jgi:hypothetical protein
LYKSKEARISSYGSCSVKYHPKQRWAESFQDCESEQLGRDKMHTAGARYLRGTREEEAKSKVYVKGEGRTGGSGAIGLEHAGNEFLGKSAISTNQEQRDDIPLP